MTDPDDVIMVNMEWPQGIYHIPEPTPELEAAARAMLTAYEKRVLWGQLRTPEEQCLVLARAAFAAVLLAPASDALKEELWDAHISEPDRADMDLSYILRAAGRHILGEDA